MTGLLIFFGIILVILGILMIPVHAAAYYKEEFSLKIKFLFFFKYTIFPNNEEKKEEKPKEKTSKKLPEEKKKEKRKMTLEETVDFIIESVRKYGPGAKMILHNIRFHKAELYWKVGAEDAAACGIKYGRICGWLSGALGFFRNLTKIEKTKIRVFPDFISEKDEIYGGADIEFNPLIIIIGVLRILFVFIKDTSKTENKKPVNSKNKIKTKESASV